MDDDNRSVAFSLRDILGSRALQSAGAVLFDLFRMPMTVYDARDPETATDISPKNLQPFCKALTASKIPARRTLCEQCDRQHFEVALKRETPLVYRCYAGLTEIFVPIRVDGNVVALLQTGQVHERPPHEADFERVWGRLKHLGLDRQEMMRRYFSIRVVPRRQIRAIAELMQIFAEHIAEAASAIRQLRVNPSRAAIQEAIRFCKEHFAEPIGLSDVAKHIHLHPGYLCHLFRRQTGATLTKYLQGLRIGRAKKLLAETDRSIIDIAWASGFESISHFNHLFKKTVGMSPSAFRASLRLSFSAPAKSARNQKLIAKT